MSTQPDNSSPDPTGRTQGEPSPPQRDPRGTTLGDFELRREIGRGGMGTVYEAWECSLQRTVALKVLSNQVGASRSAIVRFKREAQAAAKLHHTHIVPIFAQGEQDGVYFYAMELVDGVSLNAIIADARGRETADTAGTGLDDTVTLALSPGEPDRREDRDRPTVADAGGPSLVDSTVILAQTDRISSSSGHFRSITEHIASVADALDYAHIQGVIHRDIKPHNLLMGRDGRLRISDFGLARLAQQPGVTVTGELLGSPLYMSAEQISAGPGKVDARTDVYSLGVTMYEWLTLTPPFPGDSRERVISQILSAEPRSLRNLNPRIPVDLETICLKAIERDRDRRYQTAGELRDDLRRFLLNVPVMAKRAGLITRARKFAGRHPLATLSAAAVTVALTLSGALVSKESEVRTQTTVALEATAAAEEATEESARIFDLLTLLKEAPPEIRALVSLTEAAVPVAQDIVGGGRANVPTLAAVPSAGAEVALAATPAGIARRAAAEFYESLRAAAPLDPAADGADDLSHLLREASDLSASDPQAAQQSVDRYLALRPEDLRAWQLRMALHGRLGQFDEMVNAADRLVGLRPQDPSAYVWRGLAHLLLDQGEQSLQSLTRALRLDGDSTWAGSVRGLVLLRLGRTDEAILEFDDALRRSPDLVIAMLGRAIARAATGDVPGAIADLSRVIEMEPGNADTLAMRAEFLVQSADFAAALADLKEAMTLSPAPAIFIRYLFVLSQQRARSDLPSEETEGPTDGGSNGKETGGSTGRARSG